MPEDIDAIVVYLRSVKPVPSTAPDPEYKMAVAREPYPDAERGFATESFSEPAAHGKYLATIGHCMECHAAWSRGISDFNTGLGRGVVWNSPAFGDLLFYGKRGAAWVRDNYTNLALSGAPPDALPGRSGLNTTITAFLIARSALTPVPASSSPRKPNRTCKRLPLA